MHLILDKASNTFHVYILLQKIEIHRLNEIAFNCHAR